jgi:hypothetical protein
VATNNAPGRGGEGASKVFRFASDGKFDDAVTIRGQADPRLVGLTGLAFDAEGELFALDGSTGRVLNVDFASGIQKQYARIPDIPACSVVVAASACETSTRDSAPLPKAAAFDSIGTLYVSDMAQGVVWRVPPRGGVPEVWYQPEGHQSSTGIAGLQIDRNGSIIFVVSTSVSPEAKARSVVNRVQVMASGRPGRRTVVARTQPGEVAAGLAVGATGRIYLALPEANQLLVIDAQGAERGRIPPDVAANQSRDVPFDAPTGVVMRGYSVLTTNQSSLANNASHWAVLDVAVEDTRT